MVSSLSGSITGFSGWQLVGVYLQLDTWANLGFVV